MRSFNIKLFTLCLAMGLGTFSVQSYAYEEHIDHIKDHTIHADPKTCTELPKDMNSWKQPVAISSAKSAVELSQSKAAINQAVQATLFPTRTVKFVVPTEERGGSVSFSGMVQFDVPTQSTYRIVTDSRPWVEMIQDGKTVASSKHQHGAKCLGMEKMLDFPLSPGRHVLEFTANGKETIKFIIVTVAK